MEKESLSIEKVDGNTYPTGIDFNTLIDEIILNQKSTPSNFPAKPESLSDEDFFDFLLSEGELEKAYLWAMSKVGEEFVKMGGISKNGTSTHLMNNNQAIWIQRIAMMEDKKNSVKKI